MKRNNTKSFLVSIFILVLLFTSCISNGKMRKKQVVVTAPSVYNERLCRLINNDSMLTAVSLPVVETILEGHEAEIDSIINTVSCYDWLAFPSRNAVKALFVRAAVLGKTEELKTVRYCAIGKDQEYLRHFGVTHILNNSESSPQGIVQALSQTEKPGKIAVFVPEVQGMPEPDVVPNFIDSLQAIGWHVARVNAYTTKVCITPQTDDVISRIKQGQVDLIAFTSTGEIEALLSIVGGKSNLSKVPIACFGPYTYANAEKLGLKPVFMAKDFSSFEGYVEAMVNYFDK